MRKIKKAQVGDTIAKPKLSPYMQKRAIADKRREEIIRKKDSILNRDAAARHMTREEQSAFLKKNAKKSNVPIEGLYTKADTKKANAKEGPNILQKVAGAFSKPHCIFSDENKSGCNSGESAGFKSGGRIKKAQSGTKVPEAKDTAPAKKAKAILDKQKAALKKKGYAKSGGRITSKKK